MFKHILIPTDGSELSLLAVERGVQVALAFGAKVTGFHAIPAFHTFTYHADMLEATRAEYVASAKQSALKILQALRDIAERAGVECDTQAATSDHPHEAIVHAAQACGCDLIVMASHGRRGLQGFLLGSETQKVLTHSKLPVLVLR